MDKKFLNVKSINFEKVDKPEGGGGGRTMSDIHTYLVVFRLYLVIIKIFFIYLLNRNSNKNYIYFNKSG